LSRPSYAPSISAMRCEAPSWPPPCSIAARRGRGALACFKCGAAPHQESPSPRPRELSEHAAIRAHVGDGGPTTACSHRSDIYSRSPRHRCGRKLRPEVLEKQDAVVKWSNMGTPQQKRRSFTSTDHPPTMPRRRWGGSRQGGKGGHHLRRAGDAELPP
jgi:hypothetical protein